MSTYSEHDQRALDQASGRELDRRAARTVTALDRAAIALCRADECGSSMLRADYLYRARDALIAAGHPEWADLVESAALRIGGGDEDMRKVAFNIDQEISHRKHALP